MRDLQGSGEAPWRVCFVLGPGSQDLMRKPRNRESLVPPLQGTVYLISCIFMKKFMTLRPGSQGLGWACIEKQIPEDFKVSLAALQGHRD